MEHEGSLRSSQEPTEALCNDKEGLAPLPTPSWTDVTADIRETWYKII
jgi:hypothetical protein